MFENSKELALHKLIILYLLERLDYPIPNAQLTHLVLARDYIDYFSLQQYLGQLVSSNLIIEVEENEKTYYEITTLGRQTLEFFSNRIPTSTRKELEQYILETKKDIKRHMEVTAQYYPENDTEFLVHCMLQEDRTVLVDLKVAVASKEEAKKMINTFETKPELVYQQLIHILLDHPKN